MPMRPAFRPASGGGHTLVPYMRQMSAYIEKLDLVDIEEKINAVKEKLDEKLDSAKEGIGAMKEKFEGGARGEKEEGEVRELKR